MSKPYYEDYATHAMRFYARNPALCMNKPGLKLTDIQNWNACNDALRHFSEQERAIIVEVFRSKCAINDSVDCIAAQFKTEPGRIWQLLNRFSKEFAKNRGLT